MTDTIEWIFIKFKQIVSFIVLVFHFQFCSDWMDCWLWNVPIFMVHASFCTDNLYTPSYCWQKSYYPIIQDHSICCNMQDTHRMEITYVGTLYRHSTSNKLLYPLWTECICFQLIDGWLDFHVENAASQPICFTYFGITTSHAARG